MCKRLRSKPGALSGSRSVFCLSGCLRFSCQVTWKAYPGLLSLFSYLPELELGKMKAAKSALPSRVAFDRALPSSCFSSSTLSYPELTCCKAPFLFSKYIAGRGGGSLLRWRILNQDTRFHFYDKCKFSTTRQILHFKWLKRVVPRHRIPND